MKFLSLTANQTKKCGAKIGKLLEPGDVVAINGELGAGKTTLVKGIAKGLGFKESDVVSPTFSLINQYAGSVNINHIDWYRLDKVTGPDAGLAEECFSSLDAITLVEWAERGKKILPKERIEIKLSHKGSGRIIDVAAKGKKHEDFIKKMNLSSQQK